MSIEWSDDLLLGLGEVDQQHRMLVESQGQLEKALRANSPEQEVGAYLTDMLEYARIHFATEEELMRPYADRLTCYQTHLEQHREFVQLSLDLMERFRKEGSALGRELIALLGSWTANHIKVTDRTMRDELRVLCASE